MAIRKSNQRIKSIIKKLEINSIESYSNIDKKKIKQADVEAFKKKPARGGVTMTNAFKRPLHILKKKVCATRL